MKNQYLIDDHIPIPKIRGTGRKTKDARKQNAVNSAAHDHIQGMSIGDATDKNLVAFAGSVSAIHTYTRSNFRKRIKARIAELSAQP